MKRPATTRSSISLAIALVGVSATGCDPEESENIEPREQLIVELEEDDAEVSPPADAEVDVVATVELPEGGTISFVAAGGDSVAVVVNAAPESAPLIDYLMETYAPTPLELFRNFERDGEAPELLVANHEAEVRADGNEGAEPRSFVVPRLGLPNSGTVTNYERCHVQNQWEYDWTDSFDHRDVSAAATFNNTQLLTAAKFYSGAGDVQRVNWGVCMESYYWNQVEHVEYAMYKSNEPFNYGCGGSDWTLVTLPIEVSEDTVEIIYYYAGTTPDKTCIRLWAPTFGVGDEKYRNFGAAVAYDNPLGL